ncbi:MAG: lipoprotein [Pseudomonadota bacterium]
MRRFGSRYLKLLWLLLGVVVLHGCGKKGPLYLPDAGTAPDKPAAHSVAPTAAQPEK